MGQALVPASPPAPARDRTADCRAFCNSGTGEGWRDGEREAARAGAGRTSVKGPSTRPGGSTRSTRWIAPPSPTPPSGPPFAPPPPAPAPPRVSDNNPTCSSKSNANGLLGASNHRNLLGFIFQKDLAGQKGHISPNKFECSSVPTRTA